MKETVVKEKIAADMCISEAEVYHVSGLLRSRSC